MSRRRTLIANEIPNLQFQTQEEVDDEAEKRIATNRRKSGRFDDLALAQRRRNRPDVGNDTESSNRTSVVHKNSVASAVPKPSNEQLSCLYNNCVKLLNENKINAKNAFQLKLIDYMSDIVLNSGDNGVTNFQVVGCTIDVGSKIYAARVDALHLNTYQVLSGLNHQSNEDENMETGQQNDMDDNNNEDENDDPNSKKAKAAKKRRLKKSSHIVTADNIDSITLKMRDEYKDEDLYFAKKSTCIENEAIGGILLNKLHLQNDGIKMLINADDQQYMPPIETKRNNDSSMNFKSMFDSYTSSSADLRNLKLCPDLSSFKFIDYHLDENNDMSKLVESMVQPEKDEALEAHRFDANNLQMSRLDVSLQIAAGDVDIDECMHDFGNDVENLDIDTETVPKLTQQVSGLDLLDDMKVMNSIADLSTLISHTPSDYSYFNFDKLKMLNLPKHLKKIAHTIALENGAAGERGNVVQKNAKTTKRMAPRIDFSINVDHSKLLKVTKKAVYLCDRTIEKRSEKPCRLETERTLNYDSKELLRPYCKKITAKIVNNINSDDFVENLLNVEEGFGAHKHHQDMSHARGIDDDDIGGIDGDFEIPGTAQTNEPFFTQDGGQFTQSDRLEMNPMGHDLELMHQEDIGDLANTSRFDGENLVQAPMQVNALNIEYAKTAKNIDVRRLKQVIWNLLCNNENMDKENINNSANDTNNSLLKQKSSALEVNASLKNIYKQLIPPLISQRVYDDLSICIVFQMILFLANEHNLLLKHDQMGLDVQITNY